MKEHIHKGIIIARINVYDPIYDLSSHYLIILRLFVGCVFWDRNSELKYVPKAFSYAMAPLGGKIMYSFLGTVLSKWVHIV
jgi:hypothetical protein